MEKQRAERRRRVVLVPSPFQGHMTPMLQLGTILYSNGFSITVVHTHFNPPNPSHHPEFNFQSISDGLTADDISTGINILITNLLNVNCEAPFYECMVRMMEQQQQQQQQQQHPAGDDQIACIIYDEIFYFPEAAANQLNLQSIILRTTSAATQISRLALLHLEEEGSSPLQDPNKLQDPVPGLHPLRFKDLPTYRHEIMEHYLQLITSMYKIRTSSAVIWNTMHYLEESSLAQLQQQCQVPIFPIGPFHKFAPFSTSCNFLNEDTSCISWLNNQAPESVIYVSLGSVASMDKKELEEMAWGLVNSKQPFLWVIRPSSNNAPEGIELLPEVLAEAVQENGCIVKWAPQKEVLSHVAVGGFWSHCGWNSTLECLCEGVPMICRPCFGDQRVNARYVSHVWRTGLELENELEREVVEKAVRRLMVGEEGEEMRQRAKNLKEEIELCITEGGSSYKSLNEFLEFIN